MSFFHKSGIVNVKMVITEEKILSNIDKVQKLINPNSKKQIVQLEDDSYFKDLVESIKTYLLEYPKKKNFPRSVYKAAYDLVEYATNQFEENTKKIEDLIRKREKNIKLASVLRDATAAVKARAKNWKEIVKKLQTKYPADVAEALNIIGSTKDKESEEYLGACKLIDAKINNLEANLHIEIDMERIEDRSKALSYIGIEVAEALKGIPKPADAIIEENVEEVQEIEEVKEVKVNKAKATKKTEKVKVAKEEVVPEKTISQVLSFEEENEDEVDEMAVEEQEIQEYQNSVTFEKKPSLWQRIKNSKLGRAISYVCKIRIRIELLDALPEGRGEE